MGERGPEDQFACAGASRPHSASSPPESRQPYPAFFFLFFRGDGGQKHFLQTKASAPLSHFPLPLFSLSGKSRKVIFGSKCWEKLASFCYILMIIFLFLCLTGGIYYFLNTREQTCVQTFSTRIGSCSCLCGRPRNFSVSLTFYIPRPLPSFQPTKSHGQSADWSLQCCCLRRRNMAGGGTFYGKTWVVEVGKKWGGGRCMAK